MVLGTRPPICTSLGCLARADRQLCVRRLGARSPILRLVWRGPDLVQLLRTVALCFLSQLLRFLPSLWRVSSQGSLFCVNPRATLRVVLDGARVWSRIRESNDGASSSARPCRAIAASFRGSARAVDGATLSEP